MNFIKKYFISSSLLYWIIVSALAIIPGYAIFDLYYLAIMFIGFMFWAIIAVQIYRSSFTKHSVVLFAMTLSLIAIIISPLPLTQIVFKDIKIKSPENPLEYLDGANGTAIARVSIFNWPYWMPGLLKKQYIANIQPSRLIKFSQNEQYLRIRGIEKSIIIEAFGEPENIYTKEEFDVWEYHPWKEHRNWTMPVYLKDGTLWSVGDTSK